MPLQLATPSVRQSITPRRANKYAPLVLYVDLFSRHIIYNGRRRTSKNEKEKHTH